jgi:N-acetylglucosaminyl-diphospho-decaprenol L-rhamnosyltransferase
MLYGSPALEVVMLSATRQSVPSITLPTSTNGFAPGESAVGIGIVTYNNRIEQLRQLLHSVENSASLLKSVGVRALVYTIDCGTATPWYHTCLSFKQLPTVGNLGFGGGMNLLMGDAFSHSLVSWFLCVNPDGMLHPRLLTEMIQCSRQYPDSLIEARQFPEEHPKPYDPFSGETLWSSGACLLIPRCIYETIGGFDPHIFMYMEDVDYSWRARAAGFSVRIAPRALFGHSVLDRKPNRLTEQYYYFSARYLAYKWHHPAEQAFYEQVIRDRGYLPGSELPPLPSDASADLSPGADQVADFSFGFVFSPRRW